MQSMRQGARWPKRGPMPSTTKIIIESALTLIIGMALLGALWVAALVLEGE